MRCTIRRKRFLKDLIKTFNVPKEGKVSDKTFTYNIVAGVLGILLCLTSLTAATWAWFGSSITAQNNTIQSGQYFVEKEVKHEATNGEGQNETLILDANENDVYNLEAGKTYHITLTGQGNVSTGYCKVTVSQEKEGAVTASASMHTQQIYTEDYIVPAEGKVGSISFDLIVNGDGKFKLTVEPCWGTSAFSDTKKIQNGGSYTYSGGAITDSDLSTETDSETNTETENGNANNNADSTETGE